MVSMPCSLLGGRDSLRGWCVSRAQGSLARSESGDTGRMLRWAAYTSSMRSDDVARLHYVGRDDPVVNEEGAYTHRHHQHNLPRPRDLHAFHLLCLFYRVLFPVIAAKLGKINDKSEIWSYYVTGGATWTSPLQSSGNVSFGYVDGIFGI